jgi:hypothetical protein
MTAGKKGDLFSLQARTWQLLLITTATWKWSRSPEPDTVASILPLKRPNQAPPVNPSGQHSDKLATLLNLNRPGFESLTTRLRPQEMVGASTADLKSPRY